MSITFCWKSEAFGLGGRERAAQILDTIGRTAQRAGPKLERAAQAAGRQAETTARQNPIHGGNGSWIVRSDTDRRQVKRPGMRDRRMGRSSEG